MNRKMHALVPVRHIVPTEAYPEDQSAAIEQLAETTKVLGTCVRPLLLRSKGFNADECAFIYEVVGDHIAYWAAARAREMEPIHLEATMAWILEDDQQVAAAFAQLSA